jgi:hypothetical protein
LAFQYLFHPFVGGNDMGDPSGGQGKENYMAYFLGRNMDVKKIRLACVKLDAICT